MRNFSGKFDSMDNTHGRDKPSRRDDVVAMKHIKGVSPAPEGRSSVTAEWIIRTGEEVQSFFYSMVTLRTGYHLL